MSNNEIQFQHQNQNQQLFHFDQIIDGDLQTDNQILKSNAFIKEAINHATNQSGASCIISYGESGSGKSLMV